LAASTAALEKVVVGPEFLLFTDNRAFPVYRKEWIAVQWDGKNGAQSRGEGQQRGCEPREASLEVDGE